MQYGNPYFAQPFQQIQPYQDRLAQLQNSYQQAMPYGQAQIQQPIQQMPQQEEKYLGRMGYDRYRYSNGRFAPKGRGTRKGYRPYLYMQDDDWMDEYLNNPEFERNMYRMGYHPDRSDMEMGDMNRKKSRYGESYDRYDENRRHYHDSKDTESKRKMDDSMKEYTSDIIRNLTEMWSDADATLRQSMKTDLTRLVQQMN